MKIPLRVPTQFGATRKGDVVRIKVLNRTITAEFLGRGRFSNVFGTEKYAYAFSWHGDESKSILSDCDHMRHIPKIELVDMYEVPTSDHFVRIYKMRRYLNQIVNPLWNTVLKHLKNVHQVNVLALNGNRYDSDVCMKINMRVAEDSHIPHSLRDALHEIAFRATNYEAYLFDDFSRRNVGSDHKGDLVLLDPLFSARIVRDDIIARRKEQQYYEQR